MDTITPPQAQAFMHLSSFVKHHDASRTLLIVYYAGHGYHSSKGTGYLALSGKPIYYEDARIAASIEWNEVERTLVATSSDVLVIFDCCHAGLLCRSAQDGLVNRTRIFQYLGACESEQRTKSSGSQSFTAAIIWALKELAEESDFPITTLVKKIEARAEFPHHQQRPVLFGGRFAPVSENIRLARMPNTTPQAKSSAAATGTEEHKIGSLLEFSPRVSWIPPTADIIRNVRILGEFIHRCIIGFGAIAFVAKCSLKDAVARGWTSLVQVPHQPPHLTSGPSNIAENGDGSRDSSS